MDVAAEIRASLGEDWLPLLYARIRKGRTRAITIDISARENDANINYTLLGIELKVGRRRFSCPDLATARYMRVFARVGCSSFAVPYDISRISGVADELETSWQKTLLFIDEAAKEKPLRSRSLLRSKVIKQLRSEVTEIGPGEMMPTFDRDTRQHK